MNATVDVAAAVAGIGLLLFLGLASGLVLRVSALAYPPGDRRREEMLAELYAVPLRHRWIWVGEQAERALGEGLSSRIAARRDRVDQAPPPPKRQSSTDSASRTGSGLSGIL